MLHHLNTLFVFTQDSYLAKDGQAIAVRAEQQVKLRLPVHNLGGVVCFGGVGISPRCMALCTDTGLAARCCLRVRMAIGRDGLVWRCHVCREMNRVRSAAGLSLLRTECLNFRRRIVRPFGELGAGGAARTHRAAVDGLQEEMTMRDETSDREE